MDHKVTERDIIRKFATWWPRLDSVAADNVLYRSKSSWRLDMLDGNNQLCTLEFHVPEPKLFCFSALTPNHRRLPVPGLDHAKNREEALCCIQSAPSPRAPVRKEKK